jgi:hypothetical protein
MVACKSVSHHGCSCASPLPLPPPPPLAGDVIQKNQCSPGLAAIWFPSPIFFKPLLFLKHSPSFILTETYRSLLLTCWPAFLVTVHVIDLLLPGWTFQIENQCTNWDAFICKNKTDQIPNSEWQEGEFLILFEITVQQVVSVCFVVVVTVLGIEPRVLHMPNRYYIALRALQTYRVFNLAIQHINDLISLYLSPFRPWHVGFFVFRLVPSWSQDGCSCSKQHIFTHCTVKEDKISVIDIPFYRVGALFQKSWNRFLLNLIDQNCDTCLWLSLVMLMEENYQDPLVLIRFYFLCIGWSPIAIKKYSFLKCEKKM